MHFFTSCRFPLICYGEVRHGILLLTNRAEETKRSAFVPGKSKPIGKDALVAWASRQHAVDCRARRPKPLQAPPQLGACFSSLHASSRKQMENSSRIHFSSCWLPFARPHIVSSPQTTHSPLEKMRA